MKVIFFLHKPPPKANGQEYAPVEYIHIEHSQAGRSDVVSRRASGADKAAFPMEYAAFLAELSPAPPAPAPAAAPVSMTAQVEKYFSKKAKGK